MIVYLQNNNSHTSPCIQKILASRCWQTAKFANLVKIPASLATALTKPKVQSR